MKFEVDIARDGNQTLTVDGIHVYSKYKPMDHVESFIEKEINHGAEGYLLLGLGLGYHLQSIVKKVKSKKIYVLCVDKQEQEIFIQSTISQDILTLPNVHIIYDPKEININKNFQIIIPNAWLQVLNKSNPLYNFLADIKIKQESYSNQKKLLDENFSNNIRLNDKNLKHYLSETKRDNKIACLVSSGPSLNETKTWIKNVREQLYILCVGSALKVLLKEGIKPDAVIISDPKKNIIQQLEGINFDGVLFYLSTANYEATSNYSYTRYILFQSGFKKAEEIAKQNNIPLVETGGSVATTGFSTLKFLGFDTIVLFGQDLGFKENKTHATFSTSGRTVHKNENLLKVLSNNGEEIYTTPNLHSYLMWFNTKMKDSTNLKVFNTALNGAKIHKVEFINQDKFYKIVYSYKSE